MKLNNAERNNDFEKIQMSVTVENAVPSHWHACHVFLNKVNSKNEKRQRVYKSLFSNIDQQK
jgi:hypothetical protein